MSGNRANPVYGGTWLDPDFETYDPLKMLLFIFYVTNPFTSKSGVYTCTTKRASDMTGLPRALIRHYNGTKILSVSQLAELVAPLLQRILECAEESSGFKNILFDNERQIVFVRNLLERSLGGRPEWVASSIIGDHKKTQGATELWNAWKKKYRKRIDASPELTRYFTEGVLIDIPEQQIDAELPNVPETVDYESEIQRLLNRYTIENDQGGDVSWRLDSEDRACVLRVFKYLTSDLRTGAPLKAKTRYEILKRADKEPTVLVARTAGTFEEQDCIKTGKRANYFFGILRNSALSWFIEWRSEVQKANEKGERFGSKQRTRSAKRGEQSQP